MAPAGNSEAFYGAIHAGADAVYLGGERFGARAYAENFTTEELIHCIRYAHIWGRRVYLTVNTLVKETELAEIVPYLEPFYRAGLDGVIVQDLGVFMRIREAFPDLPLHVSTQMTITTQYGADYMKKLGAVRIVPARELSLSEIKEIKARTGLEMEVFIHGAMCYCYSGQCLFSSILGARSGNRGRCAQPCRLPYRVGDRECYPLSLKDMCTIEHLPALIDAGIDTFKIEGRMKKAEYAAGVTAIYRKYIDRYLTGEPYQVARQDLELLNQLYIRRERQDGYLERHNGRDMVTLSDPSYRNTPDEILQQIQESWLQDRPRIPVQITASFSIGAPAQLTIASQDATVCVTGDMVSAAQKQPITEENIHRQVGKLGETVFAASRIYIQMDSNCFYPLKAVNELRRAAVTQLEDALIQSHHLIAERDILQEKVETSAVFHIAASEAPAASKKAFHILLRTTGQATAILQLLRDKQQDPSCVCFPARIYLEADLVVRLYGKSADAYADLRTTLQCLHVSDTQTDIQTDAAAGIQIIIALPQILRQRDMTFLQELVQIYERETVLDGFLTRSPDGLGYLQAAWVAPDQGLRQRVPHIYTDAGFYSWNHDSVVAPRQFDGSRKALPPEKRISEPTTPESLISEPLIPEDFCLTYELKAADQRKLLHALAEWPHAPKAEKVFYGYLPLMYTANCVQNTLDGCRKSDAETQLTYLQDRYQKQFPVLRNCAHCINIIYNCVPLSLHREFANFLESGWPGVAACRIDFSIETGTQAAEIVQYFMSGAVGEPPYDTYTSGHEKRGAE